MTRKNQIKFSILLAVYKNDNIKHFKASILSLQNQAVEIDDLVIVVDGPVDEQINNYLNQLSHLDYVKIKYLKKNQGLANALNIGVDLCSNEIIFRQDSDDVSLPNRFYEQLNCLAEDNDIALLSSWTEAYDFNLENFLYIKKVPKENSEIIEYAKNRTPINHPSTVFKKSCFINIEGYPTHKNFSEDWWLSLRFIKAGYKIHNLQKTLVHVRAPENWFERRRGISYARLELTDQMLLLKNKLIDIKSFFKNILIRIPVRLMPIFIVRFVYGLIRKYF